MLFSLYEFLLFQPDDNPFLYQLYLILLLDTKFQIPLVFLEEHMHLPLIFYSAFYNTHTFLTFHSSSYQGLNLNSMDFLTFLKLHWLITVPNVASLLQSYLVVYDYCCLNGTSFLKYITCFIISYCPINDITYLLKNYLDGSIKLYPIICSWPHLILYSHALPAKVQF